MDVPSNPSLSARFAGQWPATGMLPGPGPARLELVNPVRSGRKQRQRDTRALRIRPVRVANFP